MSCVVDNYTITGSVSTLSVFEAKLNIRLTRVCLKILTSHAAQQGTLSNILIGSTLFSKQTIRDDYSGLLMKLVRSHKTAWGASTLITISSNAVCLALSPFYILIYMF